MDSSIQNTDAYIAQYSGEIREILEKTRQTIRAAAPEAREIISYGMPTFKGSRNLIHFAANKQHLGIYPGARPIVEFADELSSYTTSKGAIQFPFDRPIPYELIADITRYCVGLDQIHAEEKRKKKK